MSVEVVADIVPRNAARIPNREAVVDGMRRLTWRQLERRVNRAANALRVHLSIEPGQRVSIISDNCLEYYELFHATAAAGAVAVPLNQRLALPELEQIVERAEPAVIVSGTRFLEQATLLASHVDATIICIGEGVRTESYESLLAAASPVRDSYRPGPADAATICFTGGTTGLPKGVVISHGALAANGPSVAVAQGVREGDTHIFVRPMAVAPGHRMAVWHGYLGGTTVIAERFEPESFERLVAEERGTTSLLAPTMFQMLIDHGNPNGHDISSLRAVAYGGAPITPSLLERVVEFLSADLHQVYGGTEMSTALFLTPDDHRAGRLDSVGREVPGVRVRLVTEDGADASPGDVGEIVVRSPELMTEYWRDPEATVAALRDGEYLTGDLGIRDADGYVRIVGRRKDVVISGGFNIYPIEVENLLSTHPAVREVAVIGLPNRRWGEAVHAIVVPVGGARVTQDELIEFCRGSIASYKKPQVVEFVSELPRTNLGKVDKRVLHDERVGLGNPDPE